MPEEDDALARCGVPDPLALRSGAFFSAIVAAAHALPPGSFSIDYDTLPSAFSPAMCWGIQAATGEIYGASYHYASTDAAVPLRVIVSRYVDKFERFKRANRKAFP